MDFTGDGKITSDNGVYQYAAWLSTGADKRGICAILGLIPTAIDPAKPDQATEITREFAHRLGYSTVVFINLFALRHVDSVSVPSLSDPVGPENDRWIRKVADQAEIIIGAWGDFPRIGPRVQQVLGVLKDVDIHCVQTNRNGSPTHPLAWRQKAPKMYRRGLTDSLPKVG
jgi:hypothetical protein